jgi:hypothetical protein
VFLPGTTIGATHWVAYAMTRGSSCLFFLYGDPSNLCSSLGRVRVISRSSGDRTLLQLPSTFPPSASVTDMAVYGNRLAGVTSDGGFVVWELPELITDDVPFVLTLFSPIQSLIKTITGDNCCYACPPWLIVTPFTLLNGIPSNQTPLLSPQKIKSFSSI